MSEPGSKRITSLDQFRGYSVAAMFVVNFLGGLAITHQVLKHNNTHFSYADSIMPSFIFACGFSFRMSFLKRLADLGPATANKRFLSRSLGLILLSLMLTAFNSKFASWSEMTSEKIFRFAGELLKANLWEVLAIIGALQILILPIVASRVRVRIAAFLLFAMLHLFLSWTFNYDFVYGKPNWVDTIWGTSGKRAWDGGFFGLLSWGEIMLAGTLAFDVLERCSIPKSVAWLTSVGAGLMIVGYGLSCLTTLYNHEGLTEEQITTISREPVVPSFSNLERREWRSFLAEPPFVPPPSIDARSLNYWMMDKRVVTLSFVFFSTGFAVALYGLFVFCCDLRGGGLGLFRTFGQNPLASYIIHHFIATSILAIVPKDSPLLWALFGLVVSFGMTYFFVRFLEERKLYLRL